MWIEVCQVRLVQGTRKFHVESVVVLKTQLQPTFFSDFSGFYCHNTSSAPLTSFQKRMQWKIYPWVTTVPHISCYDVKGAESTITDSNENMTEVFTPTNPSKNQQTNLFFDWSWALKGQCFNATALQISGRCCYLILPGIPPVDPDGNTVSMLPVLVNGRSTLKKASDCHLNFEMLLKVNLDQAEVKVPLVAGKTRSLGFKPRKGLGRLIVAKPNLHKVQSFLKIIQL